MSGFWQQLVTAVTGKSNILTSLLKVEMILASMLVANHYNPEKDVRFWFYIFIGVFFFLILINYLILYNLFVVGTKRFPADRNGLRSESHVEKAWLHEERMHEHQTGIFRPN